MIAFLQENGFPTSRYEAHADTYEELLERIDAVEAQRESLDFLIDGAVVKVCDLETRQAMGSTEKFPRWAVAYKFAAEENTATLLNVTWELGRTGKLTPLAHLTPTDIGGVTVKRATLNNFGDIQRKRVAIGCEVWIRRSNDVIPEIMGRVGEAGPEETPIERRPRYAPPAVSRYWSGGRTCFASTARAASRRPWRALRTLPGATPWTSTPFPKRPPSCSMTG